MADISKITLPSGSTYDIKDATARQLIASRFTYTVCKTAADTPVGLSWTSGTTPVVGTLTASADTTNKFYLVPETNGTGDNYTEYVTVQNDETYAWEKIGSTAIESGELGNLAYKDTVTGSVSYTPNVSVASQPSFQGAEMTSTGSCVPNGSLSGGNISVTTSTATKYVSSTADGGGKVTAGTAASYTLPSLTTSVENETLKIGFSQGTFTANTPTSVTLPTFTSQVIATGIESATISELPKFSGTSTDVTVTGTTTGSVTEVKLTNTAQTISITSN